MARFYYLIGMSLRIESGTVKHYRRKNKLHHLHDKYHIYRSGLDGSRQTQTLFLPYKLPLAYVTRFFGHRLEDYYLEFSKEYKPLKVGMPDVCFIQDDCTPLDLFNGRKLWAQPLDNDALSKER